MAGNVSIAGFGILMGSKLVVWELVQPAKDDANSIAANAKCRFGLF